MKSIAGYCSLLIAIAEYMVFKNLNDFSLLNTGLMTLLSIAGVSSASYCFSDSDTGLNGQAARGCASVATFIQLFFSFVLFICWGILALRWLGVKSVTPFM